MTAVFRTLLAVPALCLLALAGCGTSSDPAFGGGGTGDSTGTTTGTTTGGSTTGGSTTGGSTTGGTTTGGTTTGGTTTGGTTTGGTTGGATGGVDNSPPAEQPTIDQSVALDVAKSVIQGCDFLDSHYCMFPWPSDQFTVADDTTDTGRLVNLSVLAMPRNVAGKPLIPSEWNRNDGFSPGQMILLRVPNLDLVKTGAVPITNVADSFRADQPVVVIDVGPAKPADPDYVPQRHLIYSELDANISKFTACDAPKPADTVLGLLADFGVPNLDQIRAAAQQLRDACRNSPVPENPLVDPGPALQIRPAVNFKEGHRYIVALRNLKDGTGAAIDAPPSFQIYRDNHTSNLPPVSGRRAHFEDIFTTLGKAGIKRSELYMAWDFTVISQRSLTERVMHIRDDALAKLGDTTPGDGIMQGTAPAIDPASITVKDNSGAGNIAREVRGVITVPSYLSIPHGSAGSTFFYTPSASGIYGDGLPDVNPVQATQTFDFLCRIPRRAFGGASDPATATTLEIERPALYGHGLLGSKSEGGGQVGAIIQQEGDAAATQGFIYCATDWIGMASHDSFDPAAGQVIDRVYYDPPEGDVLNVLTLLLDMSNFASLTDRVQQSLINFTYLGRAVMQPDGFCSLAAFKVNNTCLIDRSELYYDGNSQGGIIGGALVAISPDIKAGVLGVPGMNYSTLLQRSVDFDTYAAFMYASYQASLDQQFVLSMIQMLWDRAENNGYAQHLDATHHYANTPPKRVMLHPAFGDHQVSMWTAEAMARTIGAKLHCPAVVSGSDTSQRGPAVQPGAHRAVTAEHLALPELSKNRRHPDDEPYFGIPCLDAAPYSGNALVVWDSGPTVHDDGTPRNDNNGEASGVAPPPTNNTPPRPQLGYGGDPHEFPRSTLESRKQKSAFFKPDGAVVDKCGGKPCGTRGFDTTVH